MMPAKLMYINFSFTELTYDDDHYSGTFTDHDNNVCCDFFYDRKAGSSRLYNCSRDPDEIEPLPIWWLDRKLEEKGFLDSAENRICY